nr:hypothetical protein GTC16762_02360 [Pigmentibacter ruber]
MTKKISYKFFYFICALSTIQMPLIAYSQTDSSFNIKGKSSSFESIQKESSNKNSPKNTKRNLEGEDLVSEGKLDNTIDVGAPSVKKIRIAIPYFQSTDKAVPISKNDLNNFTKRMNSILGFTNWFEFIPLESFPKTANIALQPFQAAQWKLLKAEYVIIGKFTPATSLNKFNIEFRLFDVKSQNQLVGKLYTNLNMKTADIALKRFGDVLVGALTGTPGPFMSQIVFVGKKQSSGYGQIFIADFDGGNLKQITNNGAVNISPTWAKDGTKITYTSYKSGKPEIYNYDLISKQESKLVSNIQNSSGASWSPDGNTIAFSASTPAGATHIFTMNKFGGNKKLLLDTSQIEVEPAFSPNGKLLAYTSTKFGKPMIFIKDLVSNETKRITYAGWYNASASWTPDSKSIAFASYDRDIDRWDLFKIDADGNKIERLTLNQGDNEKPSWSPDGRFIIFQSDRTLKGARNGPKKLYVMNKDGAFQKALDIPLIEAKQPSWGPSLTEFEEE